MTSPTASAILRTTGTILMVGGAVAASPLDEAVVAGTTAGAGLPFLPVQAGVTFLGGFGTALAGASLIWASTKV